MGEALKGDWHKEAAEALAPRKLAAVNLQASHRPLFNPDDYSHRKRSAKVCRAKETARGGDMIIAISIFMGASNFISDTGPRRCVRNTPLFSPCLTCAKNRFQSH